MEPNMDNGGRWHHIGSEAETRRAMKDKNSEPIDVEMIGSSFLASRSRMTIIRASALGGDTREVVGSWVYDNDIAFMLDLMELRQLAESCRTIERI